MPPASDATRTPFPLPVARAGLLALLSLGAFILTVLSWTSDPSLPPLDAFVQQWAARWTSSAVASIMGGITHLASVPVVIGAALLVAGIWWRRTAKRHAAIWLAAFAAGEGLLFALKHVFGRIRPSAPDSLIRAFGFPSGHAFSAVLIYGMLLLLGWTYAERRLVRWGLAAGMFGIILAIGGSRLVLNVHYATDVLGGYALGAFWLAITWILLAYSHPSRAAPQSPD